MKKIIKSLGLVVISVFLLSGCSYKNGMKEVSKSEMQENSQYVVHIGNKSLLENEKKFINEYVSLLKKGVELDFTLLENDLKVTKLNKSVSFESKKSDTFSYSYLNYPYKETKTIFRAIEKQLIYSSFKKVDIQMKKSVVKLDFKIDGRTLVSTKKYKNSKELFYDTMRLAFVNKSKELKELGYKYGINHFSIDLKDMDKLTFTMIPITKLMSLKDITERHLKVIGYNITNDIDKANVKLEVDYNAFMETELLEGLKRESALLHEKLNVGMGNAAMNIAGAGGSSSGNVAGVGVALVAIDFLLSSSDGYTMLPIVRKIDTDKIYVLLDVPREYGYLSTFQKRYSEKGIEASNGDFSRFSESIDNLIKTNGSKRKGQKLIKLDRNNNKKQ